MCNSVGRHMETKPKQLDSYPHFVQSLIEQSNDAISTFQGGRLKDYARKWQQITSDREVLGIVTGYKIEFSEQPYQARQPHETRFQPGEMSVVKAEIDKLLSKGVIEACDHEPGEYISSIFLREKKDGTHRVILNLKHLNKFVQYRHFKMETLDIAVKLIKPGAFAGSLDLKDGYYHVPIWQGHTKYLKFWFNGTLYKYVALPNGLKSGPQIFTKIMKVAFSVLRKQGHESAVYLDDSYLQGDNRHMCEINIRETALWLMESGFVIHPIKSVLEPTQVITHVGFVLDLVSMEISLPADKVRGIKQSCEHLAHQQHPAIREVAKVIGSIVASFPAVPYGKLHYRCLEMDKIRALTQNQGDFARPMSLSAGTINELKWWADNTDNQKRTLRIPTPSMTLLTDASDNGWGAVLHSQNAEHTAGGWFTEEETTACGHINAKELLAVWLGLQSFGKTSQDVHIKILVDNVTAVAYLRQMGGTHSYRCNRIARDIWLWAEARGIWLTASHIPGIQNVQADRESRTFHKDTEWKLSTEAFHHALNSFACSVDIDLMASRTNHQVPKFMSWRPEPKALAVDAFTTDWHDLAFWCFPPFSVIPRVLQKIREDRATGLVLMPHWPTQAWFPAAMHLLVDHPRLLPKSKTVLELPERPREKHPLQGKLELMICRLSGDPSRTRDYQKTLLTSSSVHGGLLPSSSTGPTYRGGRTIVIRGKLIPFIHLFLRSWNS